MTPPKNFILNTKHQLLILLLLTFGLNINTLFNEYAFDDSVVITENTIVEKGIKGIPEIFTTDFFGGFKKKDFELPGGRYRPIALMTFALERQFFGKNPFVSHLINILLFAILISLLYKLLQTHIFREQHKYLAFITCLLFIVHPIHTEVIANIKSRDELITFIFLIVSSFSIIWYAEKRSLGFLILGLLSFFLALLTRESAVPFIAQVPLVSYFFYKQTIKKSLILSIPLFAVFAVYLLLRISMVGSNFSTNTEIMNSPFLFASHTEAFATKVLILCKYLSLLVFPYPLSCDYSYNQIPYIDISSFAFILSFLLILGLISLAVYTFNKKSIFSFCILYFLITIFLFSNFVIDIGAPLAERLLFQPSLAFCIVLAILYLKAADKYSALPKISLIAVLLIFSVKTVLRNNEWKNNQTLFFADVLSAPNSVGTNLYAAQQYISKAQNEPNNELRNEYFKKAVYHDEKILKIYPHYDYIYEGLGFAYLGLKDYSKATDIWLKAYALNPSNTNIKKDIVDLSNILYNEGNKLYKMGNTVEAIKIYKKSLELNYSNIDVWHNLSKSYSLINDKKNAEAAWQNVLLLDTMHKYSNDGFNK